MLFFIPLHRDMIVSHASCFMQLSFLHLYLVLKCLTFPYIGIITQSDRTSEACVNTAADVGARMQRSLSSHH